MHFWMPSKMKMRSSCYMQDIYYVNLRELSLLEASEKLEHQNNRLQTLSEHVAIYLPASIRCDRACLWAHKPFPESKTIFCAGWDFQSFVCHDHP